MPNQKIIKELKRAGVEQLREYGYPAANSENITTNVIYKAFFKTMLEGTLGKSKAIDDGINFLINEILIAA